MLVVPVVPMVPVVLTERVLEAVLVPVLMVPMIAQRLLKAFPVVATLEAVSQEARVMVVEVEKLLVKKERTRVMIDHHRKCQNIVRDGRFPDMEDLLSLVQESGRGSLCRSSPILPSAESQTVSPLSMARYSTYVDIRTTSHILQRGNSALPKLHKSPHRVTRFQQLPTINITNLHKPPPHTPPPFKKMCYLLI